MCETSEKSLVFFDTSKMEKVTSMDCLQHLECERVKRMPKGLSRLVYLRTLRSAKLDLSVEEDFANMTQLQDFAINRLVLWKTENNGREELRKVFGKAGGFPSLGFLKIAFFDELEEFPELGIELRDLGHIVMSM